MTVADTTNPTRNDYIGNDSQTVFAFTFEVLLETNRVDNKTFSLKVLLTENNIETEQTEITDYTVQYNDETRQGTITFVTAPTSTQQVTILSDLAKSQDTDYINIGTDKFPADSHEGTVDKLTLISREQREQINRSILLPESSNLTNVTIPVSVENANKAIVVNNDGDDLTAANLADIGTAPVTDFAKDLLADENAQEARTTLDAEQKASSLSEITSLEDADQFIVADSSDSNNSKKITKANIGLINATTTNSGFSILSNLITISNNSTDPEHDIDFTDGVFQFDDGSGQAVASALTKQIDEIWSSGNNAGGLDTGSVAADTTYYMFAIYNPTTTTADYLFSTSFSSPTLPSGYTKQKRIAALITDGGANIRVGKYYFNPDGSYRFQYDDNITDVSVTTISTGSRTLYPLTVPPSFMAVFGFRGFTQNTSAGTKLIYITDPNQTDTTTPTFVWIQGANENESVVAYLECGTDSSSQIGIRGNDPDPDINIYTRGWIDYNL